MRRIGSAGWVAGVMLLGAPCTPHAVAAEMPVDLELVLAVDVSGSMDRDEQAIQRRGYVEAFSHPDLMNAVRSGPYGRIAVTLGSGDEAWVYVLTDGADEQGRDPKI